MSRQNIVVYARKLTYNDKVLWPQNLGAVTIANYTFIVDTHHQIHINNMLENINFTTFLPKQKINHEQHEFIDI